MSAEHAPRVARIEWGRIELADGATFKDVKLWPGGAREWDWNETGTRHVPGVQPADVEELLEAGVTTLVVGCGMLGALRVRPETLDLLSQSGVEARIGRTGTAVGLFNELREAGRVGALLHSTC